MNEETTTSDTRRGRFDWLGGFSSSPSRTSRAHGKEKLPPLKPESYSEAGVELAYRNGRPVVVLKGISIMGVPLPNAWMGGIKDIDEVREFGKNKGFWKAFADGVDNIRVDDGELRIKLKE